MYVPRPFAEPDLGRLHATLRGSPFATLVSLLDGELFASHVPLLVDERRGPLGTLLGHLAGANPQVRALDGAAPALAIFQGPHAYVSPRWYAGTPNVPTWNYVAVHARGVPRRIEEPERVRELLARSAARFEAEAAEPWSLEAVPAEWAAGMQRAIVAFELPIERLEGKAKLSQNKSAADRAGVIAGLSEAGDPGSAAVARCMERLP